MGTLEEVDLEHFQSGFRPGYNIKKALAVLVDDLKKA